jgi:hypothetical protein
MAENIPNLRHGYYVFTSAGKSLDWRKVYVDGEYGFVQDGKPMFPEYVDGLHCKEFELDPALPVHIGLDFGLTPAAIFGQRTRWGSWRWRHELVTTDMGGTRFARLLGGFIREHYPPDKWTIGSITGDPAGRERGHDADESTMFDILKKENIFARPAYTNDPTVRRDAVANCLTRLDAGEPGLLIHPECRVARKGMAGKYCLRRVQVVGHEKYMDKPEKNEFSHVCEAGEYVMLGGGEGRSVVRSATAKVIAREAISDYSVFGS